MDAAPIWRARFRLFRVSLARASRTHARCEAKRAVARAPSPDVVATRLSLGRRAEPMRREETAELEPFRAPPRLDETR